MKRIVDYFAYKTSLKNIVPLVGTHTHRNRQFYWENTALWSPLLSRKYDRRLEFNLALNPKTTP
jgi:hypothetical protein